MIEKPTAALEVGDMLLSLTPKNTFDSLNHYNSTYGLPAHVFRRTDKTIFLSSGMAIFGASIDFFPRCEVSEEKATRSELRRIYFSFFSHLYWSKWGCDPELFLQTPDGKILPAWLVLPSKQHSSEFFWDGVQAEFKSNRGFNCLEQQATHIAYGLRKIFQADGRKNKHKLLLTDVAEVPDEVLQSAKEEHIQLGCDPSKNIYGLRGRPVPNPRELRIRFAGGHIHFGLAESREIDWHDNPSEEEIYAIVHPLDAILGVLSVALFEGMENQIRRQYYGLPGEYRLPPHGLEYRTLSNAWLCCPEIYYLTFEIARFAMGVALSGFFKEVWDAPVEEVIFCIQHNDAILAREIYQRNKVFFLETFKRRWTIEKPPSKLGLVLAEKTNAIIMGGVRKLFPNLGSLEQEWQLEGVNYELLPYQRTWRRFVTR